MSKRSTKIEINLTKFHPERMKPNCVIYIYGRRGSGKSNLAIHLLSFLKDIPVGMCISGTELVDKAYSYFIPPMFIFTEYEKSLIEKFIDRQKNITEKCQNIKQYKEYNPKAFILLDDILQDAKEFRNDKNLTSLYTNGRHMNVTIIFLSQYSKAITPVMRTNSDYIFLLKENMIANKRILFETFGGMFPNLEVFTRVLEQCTEKHGCMVIDNTTDSTQIQDQVFYYKGKLHLPEEKDRGIKEIVPDFRTCYEQFWIKTKEIQNNTKKQLNNINIANKYNVVVNFEKKRAGQNNDDEQEENEQNEEEQLNDEQNSYEQE